MAVIDGATMGQRVADARGRAGLTQADLAQAVSLDRSALAKIENGSRRVSALELARIADAVGERIEWFVTQTPRAILSHRNVREPGSASPSIDRAMEQVARNVEFVVEHDNRLELANPSQLRRPNSSEEAEHVAKHARTLLGLDEMQPFLEAAALAAKIGMLSFSFDLGRDAADAASILLTTGGVAIVNGHLKPGRRRLALTHELGHYLFADEYTVDWRITELDGDDVWEARLDRFARAVLLPPEGLRQAWDELTESGDDLRTVAVKIGSRFRVDMATLARRLIELHIVPESDAHQVRPVRTTGADIVELNLHVSEELSAPSLARRYEEAVLRLYRAETVSAARATDLLFDEWTEWTEDDLPVLANLPESAIWTFVS